MIRKAMVVTCLTALSTVAMVANAAEKVASKPGQFCLYSSASKNADCKKQSAKMPLVKIIRHNNWVKVGLKDKEGSVGWVNVQEYNKARRQLKRPTIQTVYVTSSQDENGKQTYNVVAYRNGKPVSKAEAQKLYQRLRENQQHEITSMDHLTRRMERMMRWDWNNMDRLMSDAFPGWTAGEELPDIDLTPSESLT